MGTVMAKNCISIRDASNEELDAIVKIERQNSIIMDHDEGKYVVPTWAWNKSKFEQAIAYKANLIVICDYEMIIGFYLTEVKKNTLEIIKIEADVLCQKDFSKEDIWNMVISDILEKVDQDANIQNIRYVLSDKELERHIFLRDIFGWKCKKIIKKYYKEDDSDGYLFLSSREPSDN